MWGYLLGTSLFSCGWPAMKVTSLLLLLLLHPRSFDISYSHFHSSLYAFSHHFLFLLWPNHLLVVCYLISTYLWVFYFLFYSSFFFNFKALWPENMLGKISIFLCFLRLILWSKLYSLLENDPYTPEKNE